jgi:hypothetical protein
MKRHFATFAWMCAAFLGTFLLAVLAIYAVWYVRSWDYIHSPPSSPSDPHDAAAYALIGMEMFIGLPAGVCLGVASALFVLWLRWVRAAAS